MWRFNQKNKQTNRQDGSHRKVKIHRGTRKTYMKKKKTFFIWLIVVVAIKFITTIIIIKWKGGGRRGGELFKTWNDYVIKPETCVVVQTRIFFTLYVNRMNSTRAKTRVDIIIIIIIIFPSFFFIVSLEIRQTK